MILGRTHREVPTVWLRPVWEAGLEPLTVSSPTVVDVSTQPALWGHALRGSGAPVLARSTYALETAMNSRQAAELTEAHLIETLSAIGRPTVDFYALAVRRSWPEATLNGVLEALENAKQDGMVGHLGLAVEGPEAMAMWRMRDAFEFVIAPEVEEIATIQLAGARNVGVVIHRASVPPSGSNGATATLVDARAG